MINDTTMVETLLEAGAMVDLCDYKGRSPIMYAISNSQLYIASLLYYYHASILNPTVSLYTIACRSKFPEGTKALLNELINKEHHQDVIKKAANSKKPRKGNKHFPRKKA
jgi:ankyrin repeat protein